MKKTWIIFSLMLLSFTCSFSQAKDISKQVLDLAKKKFQWMIAGQVDSLDAVLDDRLKFIHSNGLIQSKSDVLDELKSGKLAYQTIDAREMEVRLYDHTAIVTGKAKIAGVKGTPFAVDLLFTEVYVFKNKHWRLASRHANKLP